MRGQTLMGPREQDSLPYSHSILAEALEKGNWNGRIYLWDLKAERDNFHSFFFVRAPERWQDPKDKKNLGRVSSPPKTSSIEVSVIKEMFYTWLCNTVASSSWGY